MTQGVAVWLVVIVAFVLANLPFANNRLFAVYRLSNGKNLAVRIGELVVWYLGAGSLGLYFEHSLGQISPQGWEFYAITAALFITFSFPGFVYRYLFKKRR